MFFRSQNAADFSQAAHPCAPVESTAWIKSENACSALFFTGEENSGGCKWYACIDWPLTGHRLLFLHSGQKILLKKTNILLSLPVLYPAMLLLQFVLMSRFWPIPEFVSFPWARWRDSTVGWCTCTRRRGSANETLTYCSSSKIN